MLTFFISILPAVTYKEIRKNPSLIKQYAAVLD